MCLCRISSIHHYRHLHCLHHHYHHHDSSYRLPPSPPYLPKNVVSLPIYINIIILSIMAIHHHCHENVSSSYISPSSSILSLGLVYIFIKFKLIIWFGIYASRTMLMIIIHIDNHAQIILIANEHLGDRDCKMRVVLFTDRELVCPYTPGVSSASFNCHWDH